MYNWFGPAIVRSQWIPSFTAESLELSDDEYRVSDIAPLLSGKSDLSRQVAQFVSS